MIKIGREEPVASMDNGGKIIWAKHNEIQTVNIKAVGADFEVSIENCERSNRVSSILCRQCLSDLEATADSLFPSYLRHH